MDVPENRHDFGTLAGMTLNWSLRVNSATVQTGSHPLTAQPRGSEAISLPLNLPADGARNVCALDVACVNESGRRIFERSIRLDAEGSSAGQTLLASLPTAGDLKIERQDNTARVVHEKFSVNLKRNTGEIEIRSTSGRVLASGLFPHVGRKFTLAEELRVAKIKKEATASDLRHGQSPIWPDAFLRASEVQLTEATQTADGARVGVRGRYNRTDATYQFLTGEVALEISRRGSIAVSYHFTPVNATGQILEAGRALLAPETETELRWLGCRNVRRLSGQGCVE